MAVDERSLTAGLDALELPTAPRISRGRRIWSMTWPKLLAITIVLAFWQFLIWRQWRPESAFASPESTFSALFDNWSVISEAMWTTLRRGLQGYLMAIAIGGVIGAAVARIPVLRAAIGSMITGLQTMPSIAWFPLAILLFQLSEQAILFVILIGAVPSIANGVIGGVDYVPPLLVRAGRNLGATGFGLYRHVVIPAALPSIVSGLKQGWAFAWRSLLAGELIVQIANRPSLGQFLNQSREFGDTTYMIALMLVILVIGIVVDGVFSTVDNGIRRRRGVVPSS
jgi:NitT/TauT family transport system permease protein